MGFMLRMTPCLQNPMTLVVGSSIVQGESRLTSFYSFFHLFFFKSLFIISDDFFAINYRQNITEKT